MKALLLAALLAAAIPTPKAPTLEGPCPPFKPVTTKVIESNPAVYADQANNEDQPGRVLLPDGTAEYTFTSVSECTEPLPTVPPEDPANFRPEPLKCDAPGADAEFCIDPAYMPACPAHDSPKYDPSACSENGPGEGPPGAPTVDKPAP